MSESDPARRKVVLGRNAVVQIGPVAGPVAHVDGRPVGEPGRPPAERADGDDGVTAAGEHGQVGEGVARRHEHDVALEALRSVATTPRDIIAADDEHTTTSRRTTNNTASSSSSSLSSSSSSSSYHHYQSVESPIFEWKLERL